MPPVKPPPMPGKPPPTASLLPVTQHGPQATKFHSTHHGGCHLPTVARRTQALRVENIRTKAEELGPEPRSA